MTKQEIAVVLEGWLDRQFRDADPHESLAFDAAEGDDIVEAVDALTTGAVEALRKWSGESP